MSAALVEISYTLSITISKEIDPVNTVLSLITVLGSRLYMLEKQFRVLILQVSTETSVVEKRVTNRLWISYYYYIFPQLFAN